MSSHQPRQPWLASALLAVCLAAPCSALAAPVHYNVIPLEPLVPGGHTRGYSMRGGYVAGEAENSNGQLEAVLWDANTGLVIRTLNAGDDSVAFDYDPSTQLTVGRAQGNAFRDNNGGGAVNIGGDFARATDGGRTVGRGGDFYCRLGHPDRYFRQCFSGQRNERSAGYKRGIFCRCL